MNQLVLVTGGNGFLGSHLIILLLKNGYFVRTTVRNEKSKQNLLKTLEINNISHDKLEIYEADLLSDENWSAAMAGVDILLSVASPVFFNEKILLDSIDSMKKHGLI